MNDQDTVNKVEYDKLEIEFTSTNSQKLVKYVAAAQRRVRTFSLSNMNSLVAAAMVSVLYDAAAHSPILMRTVSKRDFKKKV